MYSFKPILIYLLDRENNPFFGCVVGRVANRIAFGKFTVGGIEYKLAQNDLTQIGPSSLHGGLKVAFQITLFCILQITHSLKTMGVRY